MFAGLLVAPRRTLRAFLRGRHSRSLYGEDLEVLLDSKVAELRSRMGVDQPLPSLTLANALLFAVAELAGLVIGLLGFVFVLIFLPLGLLTFAMRRARQRPPHDPSQTAV